MRLKLANLKTTPNTATSFEDAIGKIERLKNRKTVSPLNPVSQTIFLSHGQPTDRAVLLLHGYSNSPQQFRMLGEQFFERGCNVLIPRMPHHGLADRMTDDLIHLTGEEMVQFATKSCDAALGLGKKLTVMGLSAGGVLTAWLSYQRPEIDSAITMSPAFGVSVLDDRLLPWAVRGFGSMPSRMLWWGEEGEMGDTQLHAYPRFSTNGLIAIWRVGFAVKEFARAYRPYPRRMGVVINENDDAISNKAVYQLIRDLAGQGVNPNVYIFTKAQGLDHDIIDPENAAASTETVYPILLGMGL